MQPQCLAVLALVLATGCSTMTLRIPRDQVQADLAKRFPVQADKRVVTIRASAPHLEFPGDRDVVAVRMRLDATTASGRSQLGGTTRVEGRLHYDAQEHAFYLRDPRVTELRLDPAEGDGSFAHAADRTADTLGTALVERAARRAVEQLLERRPIYRLDAQRSPKEAKAIRHLRSVHVDGQELVLEVGL